MKFEGKHPWRVDCLYHFHSDSVAKMVKVDREHAQNIFIKHRAKEGSCAQIWCVAVGQNAFA